MIWGRIRGKLSASGCINCSGHSGHFRHRHLPQVDPIKMNPRTFANVARKDQFLSLSILLNVRLYDGHQERRASPKEARPKEGRFKKQRKGNQLLGKLLEPLDPARPEVEPIQALGWEISQRGPDDTTYRCKVGLPPAQLFTRLMQGDLLSAISSRG